MGIKAINNIQIKQRSRKSAPPDATQSAAKPRGRFDFAGIVPENNFEIDFRNVVNNTVIRPLDYPNMAADIKKFMEINHDKIWRGEDDEQDPWQTYSEEPEFLRRLDVAKIPININGYDSELTFRFLESEKGFLPQMYIFSQLPAGQEYDQLAGGMADDLSTVFGLTQEFAEVFKRWLLQLKNNQGKVRV